MAELNLTAGLRSSVAQRELVVKSPALLFRMESNGDGFLASLHGGENMPDGYAIPLSMIKQLDISKILSRVSMGQGCLSFPQTFFLLHYNLNESTKLKNG